MAKKRLHAWRRFRNDYSHLADSAKDIGYRLTHSPKILCLDRGGIQDRGGKETVTRVAPL